MKKKYFILIAAVVATVSACQPPESSTMNNGKNVKLITVDPGHFHAALVQKYMYDEVDSVVHVYAPEGPDVQMHLSRIEAFNAREKEPTRWQEEVYTGADFFEKMLEAKSGNVVVLAGNNRKKTEYIKRSLESGFHVLADKPMAIDQTGFDLLQEAFTVADSNDLLLYDIMTERHEITTMLQKEFSLLPDVFGTLQEGTPDNPAVTKESVHHFYKYVSGNVLTRPAWFMDVEQEGEGIVDVTTHLVDLIQWECFPEQVIDYKNDIRITSAKRWVTGMTLGQFKSITKLDQFPDYLKKDIVNDTILNVYCNGEINYSIKGVNAKVSVIWAFKAPEGGGDTHYSVMRGTKANLVIRQGAGEQFKPVLYIEPLINDKAYEDMLSIQIRTIQAKYPGVDMEKTDEGWKVIIPAQYHVGHEEHFAQVTEKFLGYLRNGDMPQWEVPNMIAKYYITTKALEIAKSAGNQ